MSTPNKRPCPRTLVCAALLRFVLSAHPAAVASKKWRAQATTLEGTRGGSAWQRVVLPLGQGASTQIKGTDVQTYTKSAYWERPRRTSVARLGPSEMSLKLNTNYPPGGAAVSSPLHKCIENYIFSQEHGLVR